jgi:glyoxylase-like metal-dependent hydrolase (beta-lactamase superfamily II)
MSRVAKGLLLVLLAVVAVGAGAYLWLTAREPVPERSDYVLDLGELRSVASSLAGSPPAEMASALIAEGSLPRGALFAGESLREPHPMVHQVFELRGGDVGVVVDAGMSREQAAAVDSEVRFHDEAWQQALAAMHRADRIVVTHEHFDHLGGIASYAPPEDLAGRLLLRREQLANLRALDDAGFPAALRSLEPVPDARAQAIAPGVVLVQAAGHTPGSQLVYARLANGREILFIGDVAWHLEQIERLHYRPRVVTDLFLGEDRGAVLAQFRALHDLMRAHPDLVVLVSHDRDQREELVAQGLLRDGLAPSGPG